MPKIKTYIVKAFVKSGKEGPFVDIDKESMKENEEVAPFHFEDKDIAKYAQEVATFNNTEQSSILSMGEQEEPYNIEFKLIQ